MAVEDDPAWKRFSAAFDRLKAAWENLHLAAQSGDRARINAAVHIHNLAQAEYIAASAEIGKDDPGGSARP